MADEEPRTQPGGLDKDFAVLRSKVDELEKDVDELQQSALTKDLFEARVETIKHGIAAIGDDISDLAARKGETHEELRGRIENHEERIQNLKSWQDQAIGRQTVGQAIGTMVGGIVVGLVVWLVTNQSEAAEQALRVLVQ